MSPIITIIVAVVAGIVCGLGGYIYRKNVAEQSEVLNKRQRTLFWMRKIVLKR